jgi:hypothetical protein
MRKLDMLTNDPGVRVLVAFLRKHGFDTCDSGDGREKIRTMGCALPFPHVFIKVEPGTLLTEADRLMGVLVAAAVEVLPGTIEGGYDPFDGSSILELVDEGDEWIRKFSPPS